MFPHEREQFERDTTRFLRTCLPLLDGAFARVEVAGEYGLADVIRLAELLDLRRFDRKRDRQAGFIEPAHRRLIDGSHAEHASGAAMDRLESVAFVFRLSASSSLGFGHGHYVALSAIEIKVGENRGRNKIGICHGYESVERPTRDAKRLGQC
jgi:hypothetical protein